MSSPKFLILFFLALVSMSCQTSSTIFTETSMKHVRTRLVRETVNYIWEIPSFDSFPRGYDPYISSTIFGSKDRNMQWELRLYPDLNEQWSGWAYIRLERLSPIGTLPSTCTLSVQRGAVVFANKTCEYDAISWTHEQYEWDKFILTPELMSGVTIQGSFILPEKFLSEEALMPMSHQTSPAIETITSFEYARSRLIRETVNYKWEISNIESFDGRGENSIASTGFGPKIPKGLKWYLRLYPHDDYPQNYASISLIRYSHSPYFERTYPSNCTLSIQRGDVVIANHTCEDAEYFRRRTGRVVIPNHTCKDAEYVRTYEIESKTWPKFIKTSELMSGGSPFIIEGNFIMEVGFITESINSTIERGTAIV